MGNGSVSMGTNLVYRFLLPTLLCVGKKNIEQCCRCVGVSGWRPKERFNSFSVPRFLDTNKIIVKDLS